MAETPTAGLLPLVPADEPDSLVQVSDCGKTVWVFSADGSTVGRFSKLFGMDVHTTVSEQLDGAKECLHCTHHKPNNEDWLEFCRLIALHHAVTVDTGLIEFGTGASVPVFPVQQAPKHRDQLLAAFGALGPLQVLSSFRVAPDVHARLPALASHHWPTPICNRKGDAR